MKPPEVANGVHRLGTAWANYLGAMVRRRRSSTPGIGATSSSSRARSLRSDPASRRWAGQRHPPARRPRRHRRGGALALGGPRVVHDRPAAALERPSDDQTLDPAGRPRVVHVRGHAAGHCSVVLADRGVLITGDALVNFDYATGQRGLRLHRFNEDRARALARLTGWQPSTPTRSCSVTAIAGATTARALDVAGATDDNPEREPLTP
jgi:hypothetical protein